MKSAALLKAVYKDCLERGYVLHENVLYPPKQAAALGIGKPGKKKRSPNLVKTGWTDDDRNIKNKAGQRDMFMMFLEKELKLDVWPEFFFSTERLFRLDYCIPVLNDGTVIKLGIEVDGGTWSKERTGHSSGTGLARDREKSTLLATLGWLLIRVTPQELMTLKTIEIIKNIIENGRAM